jgi:SAM-dependent methyltransferase
MTHDDTNTPSAWVETHAGLIRPGGRVLDLACGSGRHTRYLVDRGFRVVAVDINLASVTDLETDARVELIEADLENDAWPFSDTRFDGIVVCNYLHRPHFPLLIEALNDSGENPGVLIFDTFAVGNERFGKPRNPDFLLRPGELLDAFSASLTVVAYAQGEVNEPDPGVRQRLCAVRSSNQT